MCTVCGPWHLLFAELCAHYLWLLNSFHKYFPSACYVSGVPVALSIMGQGKFLPLENVPVPIHTWIYMFSANVIAMKKNDKARDFEGCGTCKKRLWGWRRGMNSATPSLGGCVLPAERTVRVEAQPWDGTWNPQGGWTWMCEGELERKASSWALQRDISCRESIQISSETTGSS